MSVKKGSGYVDIKEGGKTIRYSVPAGTEENFLRDYQETKKRMPGIQRVESTFKSYGFKAKKDESGIEYYPALDEVTDLINKAGIKRGDGPRRLQAINAILDNTGWLKHLDQKKRREAVTSLVDTTIDNFGDVNFKYYSYGPNSTRLGKIGYTQIAGNKVGAAKVVDDVVTAGMSLRAVPQVLATGAKLAARWLSDELASGDADLADKASASSIPVLPSILGATSKFHKRNAEALNKSIAYGPAIEENPGAALIGLASGYLGWGVPALALEAAANYTGNETLKDLTESKEFQGGASAGVATGIVRGAAGALTGRVTAGTAKAASAGAAAASAAGKAASKVPGAAKAGAALTAKADAPFVGIKAALEGAGSGSKAGAVAKAVGGNVTTAAARVPVTLGRAVVDAPSAARALSATVAGTRFNNMVSEMYADPNISGNKAIVRGWARWAQGLALMTGDADLFQRAAMTAEDNRDPITERFMEGLDKDGYLSVFKPNRAKNLPHVIKELALENLPNLILGLVSGGAGGATAAAGQKIGAFQASQLASEFVSEFNGELTNAFIRAAMEYGVDITDPDIPAGMFRDAIIQVAPSILTSAAAKASVTTSADVALSTLVGENTKIMTQWIDDAARAGVLRVPTRIGTGLFGMTADSMSDAAADQLGAIASGEGASPSGFWGEALGGVPMGAVSTGVAIHEAGRVTYGTEVSEIADEYRRMSAEDLNNEIARIDAKRSSGVMDRLFGRKTSDIFGETDGSGRFSRHSNARVDALGMVLNEKAANLVNQFGGAKDAHLAEILIRLAREEAGQPMPDVNPADVAEGAEQAQADQTEQGAQEQAKDAAPKIPTAGSLVLTRAANMITNGLPTGLDAYEFAKLANGYASSQDAQVGLASQDVNRNEMQHGELEALRTEILNGGRVDASAVRTIIYQHLLAPESELARSSIQSAADEAEAARKREEDSKYAAMEADRAMFIAEQNAAERKARSLSAAKDIANGDTARGPVTQAIVARSDRSESPVSIGKDGGSTLILQEGDTVQYDDNGNLRDGTVAVDDAEATPTIRIDFPDTDESVELSSANVGRVRVPMSKVAPSLDNLRIASLQIQRDFKSAVGQAGKSVARTTDHIRNVLRTVGLDGMLGGVLADLSDYGYLSTEDGVNWAASDDFLGADLSMFENAAERAMNAAAAAEERRAKEQARLEKQEADEKARQAKQQEIQEKKQEKEQETAEKRASRERIKTAKNAVSALRSIIKDARTALDSILNGKGVGVPVSELESKFSSQLSDAVSLANNMLADSNADEAAARTQILSDINSLRAEFNKLFDLKQRGYEWGYGEADDAASFGNAVKSAIGTVLEDLSKALADSATASAVSAAASAARKRLATARKVIQTGRRYGTAAMTAAVAKAQEDIASIERQIEEAASARKTKLELDAARKKEEMRAAREKRKEESSIDLYPEGLESDIEHTDSTVRELQKDVDAHIDNGNYADALKLQAKIISLETDLRNKWHAKLSSKVHSKVKSMLNERVRFASKTMPSLIRSIASMVKSQAESEVRATPLVDETQEAIDKLTQAVSAMTSTVEGIAAQVAKMADALASQPARMDAEIQRAIEAVEAEVRKVSVQRDQRDVTSRNIMMPSAEQSITISYMSNDGRIISSSYPARGITNRLLELITHKLKTPIGVIQDLLELINDAVEGGNRVPQRMGASERNYLADECKSALGKLAIIAAFLEEGVVGIRKLLPESPDESLNKYVINEIISAARELNDTLSHIGSPEVISQSAIENMQHNAQRLYSLLSTDVSSSHIASRINELNANGTLSDEQASAITRTMDALNIVAHLIGTQSSSAAYDILSGIASAVSNNPDITSYVNISAPSDISSINMAKQKLARVGKTIRQRLSNEERNQIDGNRPRRQAPKQGRYGSHKAGVWIQAKAEAEAAGVSDGTNPIAAILSRFSKAEGKTQDDVSYMGKYLERLGRVYNLISGRYTSQYAHLDNILANLPALADVMDVCAGILTPGTSVPREVISSIRGATSVPSKGNNTRTNLIVQVKESRSLTTEQANQAYEIIHGICDIMNLYDMCGEVFNVAHAVSDIGHKMADDIAQGVAIDPFEIQSEEVGPGAGEMADAERSSDDDTFGNMDADANGLTYHMSSDPISPTDNVSDTSGVIKAVAHDVIGLRAGRGPLVASAKQEKTSPPQNSIHPAEVPAGESHTRVTDSSPVIVKQNPPLAYIIQQMQNLAGTVFIFGQRLSKGTVAATTRQGVVLSSSSHANMPTLLEAAHELAHSLLSLLGPVEIDGQLLPIMRKTAGSQGRDAKDSWSIAHEACAEALRRYLEGSISIDDPVLAWFIDQLNTRLDGRYEYGIEFTKLRDMAIANKSMTPAQRFKANVDHHYDLRRSAARTAVSRVITKTRMNMAMWFDDTAPVRFYVERLFNTRYENVRRNAVFAARMLPAAEEEAKIYRDAIDDAIRASKDNSIDYKEFDDYCRARRLYDMVRGVTGRDEDGNERYGGMRGTSVYGTTQEELEEIIRETEEAHPEFRESWESIDRIMTEIHYKYDRMFSDDPDAAHTWGSYRAESLTSLFNGGEGEGQTRMSSPLYLVARDTNPNSVANSEDIAVPMFNYIGERVLHSIHRHRSNDFKARLGMSVIEAQKAGNKVTSPVIQPIGAPVPLSSFKSTQIETDKLVGEQRFAAVIDIDGKKYVQLYHVSDGLLYRTMLRASNLEMTLQSSVLAAVSNPLREFVTLSPGFFMISNPMMDALNIMAIGKGIYIPILHTVFGLSKEIRDWYIRNGGGQSSSMAERIQMDSRKKRPEKRGIVDFNSLTAHNEAKDYIVLGPVAEQRSTGKKLVYGFVDLLRSGRNASEISNRAKYAKLRYEAMVKARDEGKAYVGWSEADITEAAIFEARDMLDFSMKGHIVNLGLFRNAVFVRSAINALAKLGHELANTDRIGDNLMRSSILLSVGFAYGLSLASDEEYWKRPEAERLQYLYVRGTGVKLRKAPGLFSLVFNSGEYLARQLYLTDKEAYSDIVRAAALDMLFNPLPVLYQLLMSITSNKRYDGRPIVPPHLIQGPQSVDPAMQSTRSTPKLSKMMAGAYNSLPLPNISPTYLDYTLRGVFADAWLAVTNGAEPWYESGTVLSRVKQSAASVARTVFGRGIIGKTPYTDNVIKFQEELSDANKKVSTIRSVLGRVGEEMGQRGKMIKVKAYSFLEDPTRNIYEIPEEDRAAFRRAMGIIGYKTNGVSYETLASQYQEIFSKRRALTKIDQMMKGIKNKYYESGEAPEYRDAADQLAGLALRFIQKPAAPMNPAGTKVGGERRMTDEQLDAALERIIEKIEAADNK